MQGKTLGNPVHRVATTPRDTFQESLNEGWEQYARAQQLGGALNRVAAVYSAVYDWIKTYSLRGAVETAYLPFVQAIQIEDDPHAWLVDQVKILRSHQYDFLDSDNIAEELEAMANSDRTEVISHLRNVLANFLKLAYSAIRRSERSWTHSILLARLNLSLKVDNSRTLRNDLPEFVDTAYKQARALAANEMGLERHRAQQLFPQECPWSIDQIRNEDFLPDTAPTANGRTTH